MEHPAFGEIKVVMVSPRHHDVTVLKKPVHKLSAIMQSMQCQGIGVARHLLLLLTKFQEQWT